MSEAVSIIIGIAAIIIVLIPITLFWVKCIEDMEDDEEYQAHKNDQKWLDEHYPWP